MPTNGPRTPLLAGGIGCLLAAVLILPAAVFAQVEAVGGEVVHAAPAITWVDLSTPELRERISPGTQTVVERIARAGGRADLLLSSEFSEAVLVGREEASDPDLAVGPDDILVVAGQRRIFRLPNPSSTGVGLPFTPPSPGSPGTPTPLENFNALRAALPTSQIDLDLWLGPTILNDICPGSYNPQTCLIQYPTVRYDQLHGRFLVAFAVTDTGVRGPDVVVTQGRASTWVLLVSRRASFTKADGSAPANVFTAPGGADWLIYYGRRDAAGPGGFHSLNHYSTHPTAQPLSAPGRYSASFPESNCNPPVGDQPPLSVSAPAGEETVCLFPTDVRLGIDNDSIVLVSPVLNVNQIVPSSNTIAFTTGRYAGNRVRVLSKHTIYNGNSLQNGNALIPGAYDTPRPYSGNVAFGLAIAAPSATQFDLFRNSDLPAFCSVFDFATDTCTTTVAGFSPRRYTLGNEVAPTGSGIDTPRPPAAPTTTSNLYPLFYEPVHLRGRALARYSNYPYGGMTHLIGSYTLGTAAGQGGNLWVQPISFRADYRPALDPGDQTSVGIPGPRIQLVPDTSITPLQAPQSGVCSTVPCSPGGSSDPANLLYIGEGRPQRAIYREGHIYDARTGRPANNIYGTSISTPPPANANVGNLALWSTVYYDVVQTLYTSAIPSLPAVGDTLPFQLPMPDPSLVFYAFWQNGHFFSPMFDVPANVQRGGATSPSGLLPYFDKLFVATSSPRVGLPNPLGEGNIWPSLFDIRQGLDKFDRFDFFRDPRSGRVVNPRTGTNETNLFSRRHGAAIDPNLGGLWTYGAFANSRVGGVGQWATHAAYYDMTFAPVDPYGTGTNLFADVCPPGQGTLSCPASPYFNFIQTARLTGITHHLFAPDGSALGNAEIPPGHGIPGVPASFQPTRRVTRAEFAVLLAFGLMDEVAIDKYLTQTTPIVFSDVAGAGVDPDGFPGTLTSAHVKAIQLVARRGYLSGCAVGSFCPFAFVTRAEVAEAIARAKFSNIHPTLIAGCPNPLLPGPCVTGGDNFWLQLDTTPYFPVDVPVTHPSFGAIQTLRQLRVTNGTGVGTFSPAAFVPRDQMATLVIKALHF